jgi:hypothetical protein
MDIVLAAIEPPRAPAAAITSQPCRAATASQPLTFRRGPPSQAVLNSSSHGFQLCTDVQKARAPRRPPQVAAERLEQGSPVVKSDPDCAAKPDLQVADQADDIARDTVQAGAAAAPESFLRLYQAALARKASERAHAKENPSRIQGRHAVKHLSEAPHQKTNEVITAAQWQCLCDRVSAVVTDPAKRAYVEKFGRKHPPPPEAVCIDARRSRLPAASLAPDGSDCCAVTTAAHCTSDAGTCAPESATYGTGWYATSPASVSIRAPPTAIVKRASFCTEAWAPGNKRSSPSSRNGRDARVERQVSPSKGGKRGRVVVSPRRALSGSPSPGFLDGSGKGCKICGDPQEHLGFCACAPSLLDLSCLYLLRFTDPSQCGTGMRVCYTMDASKHTTHR